MQGPEGRRGVTGSPGLCLCLCSAKTSGVKDALLEPGFSCGSRTSQRNYLREFAGMTTRCPGLRRLGSAALDLCYVAAGRLDGYWELSLKPRDLAAGALIAADGGATVTSLQGDERILVEPYSIVAANPRLHRQLLGELVSVTASAPCR